MEGGAGLREAEGGLHGVRGAATDRVASMDGNRGETRQSNGMTDDEQGRACAARECTYFHKYGKYLLYSDGYPVPSLSF
jgi:hypothetical protein